MIRAVVLVFVDTFAGLYLLWYGLRRTRGRKEPTMIVGLMVLGCACFLTVVAYRAAHPSGHLTTPEERPAPVGELQGLELDRVLLG